MRLEVFVVHIEGLRLMFQSGHVNFLPVNCQDLWEAVRIKRCRGRLFAMQNEPEVPRVWLPFDYAPRLATRRAFGDFCLKDYKVISILEFSYMLLTKRDQFIVLAFDGLLNGDNAYTAISVVFFFQGPLINEAAIQKEGVENLIMNTKVPNKALLEIINNDWNSGDWINWRQKSGMGNTLTLAKLEINWAFIEALVRCWEPNDMVFKFGPHQLCPTLEECSHLLSMSLEGNLAFPHLKDSYIKELVNFLRISKKTLEKDTNG
ncbi:hypothetical protein IFM89_021466 [Coptis chinensis]|uniref:DUF7745 domain-containing protein n=1 Tax=Coptis chinensis TaxID=261450 RepID=A0A835M9J0_9MAGN|nr:hypothetical protein IFM89_021466 [Coptis chinensis]